MVMTLKIKSFTQFINEAITAPTDNPNFKAWFGDSKVVDAQGNPLVVYHGTAKEFDAFMFDPNDKTHGGRFNGMKGSFFTSLQWEADHYAEQSRIFKGGSERVMPVFLKIENPYVRKGGRFPTQWFDNNWEDVQKKCEAKGNDGIIVTGGTPEFPRTIYIIFHPTQVKSAIGNKGNFDKEHSDITESCSNDCKHFRKDTETCKIHKNKNCKYIDEQGDCKDYE
jgi:hypothetical protein